MDVHFSHTRFDPNICNKSRRGSCDGADVGITALEKQTVMERTFGIANLGFR